jgi:hypothetical protein
VTKYLREKAEAEGGGGDKYPLQSHTLSDLFPPARPHFPTFHHFSIAPPAGNQSYNTGTFEGYSRSKLQQEPTLVLDF